MSTQSWRRLGEGDPTRTVLAVDFDSAGRPEAGFRRFAAHLAPEREIWLTDQPAAAERELLSAADYLRWWGLMPKGPRRVDTVMGYCVGGVFASALADEIAARQGERPALLLFDPEPVDRLSLYRDFRKAADTMAVLPEQQRAEAAAEVLAVCEAAGDDDFTATAAHVVKVYETVAGAAFDLLGLDEETSEDLLGLFRSYVSYLHAARQLRPEEGWAAALALTSARSSPGAVHARAEQRFPLDTAALLDDAAVAAAAHRFLLERGA
ncbi:hypothetical protein ABZ920_10700 [Streptomyces sp. NPDC046831]|uniref:hypothetical protein n=1 Tax=Streptomyces sp. NPDC046831 TaxID=3154805 RepID=UPI003401AFC9